MIKFGTDGWRGIIGEEFTFENLRLVSQALADYLVQSCAKSIAIGYDRRFLSDMFAREAAEVLAANGLTVFLSKKPVTTPVVSFSVKSMELDAGVMITASHNPYMYNGLKIKGSYGGSAAPEMTEKIEKNIGLTQVKTLASQQTSSIILFDPDHIYLKKLRTLVDINIISNSHLKVVFDPIFGSGSGYLDSLLVSQQNIKIIQIRGEHNPLFGGVNPEPIEQNLVELKDKVITEQADIGIALDGDGDRIGIIDNNGNYVNTHQVFSLLLKHLAENRGWRGSVVKTFSTTGMLDILCKKYGFKLYETPIGFKYICELFLREDILIGGEESGGLGYKNHIPERDGLLSALLILELLTVTGKSLPQLLRELEDEVGSHYYRRVDINLSDEQTSRLLDKINSSPPAEFAGYSVTGLKRLDGFKFLLENHGWILFRLSGTEPLLRIYGEFPSEPVLQKVFEAADNFIKQL